MAISDDLNSIRTHLEDDYEALEQLGVSVEDRNIENIKDMANQIYAKFPKTDYVEGSNITLSNTLKGKLDFEDGIVGIGDTSQKSYQGYQMIHQASFGTFTNNGVTFTQRADGSILVNGTTGSNGASINLLTGNATVTDNDNNITILPNQAYTLSGANDPIRVVLHTSSYSYVKNANTTFTETGNVSMSALRIIVPADTTINNVVVYPMLEKGSTAHDYEPYVGNSPSPNPSYPQDIEVVSGKNRFSIGDISSTNLGINYSFNASEIILNGTTNTGGYIYNNASNYLELPKGAYTFTSKILSGNYTYTGDIAIYFRKVSDNSNIVTMYKEHYEQQATITLTEITKIYVAIYTNASGNVTNNFKIGVQIEKGSQATSYLPYNTIEVVERGVNDFDISQVEIGKAWNNASASNRAVCYFNASEGDIFTVSATGISVFDQSTIRVIFKANRESTSNLGIYDITTSRTFTAPTGAGIACIQFNKDNISLSDFEGVEIMINEGDTALPYEPYQTPQTYQLSLGEYEFAKIGNYVDTIEYDVENDKVYKNENIVKQVVTGTFLDNLYTFMLQSINSYGIANFLLQYISNSEETLYDFAGLCNYLSTQTSSIANEQNEGILYQQRAVYIRIKSTTASTTQEFKTYVNSLNTGGNPLIIYRQLLTPTKTEITGTLKDQIKALYYSHSFTGTTIIEIDGQLPLIIKVRANSEGVVPSGSISITSNGSHDVTNYATANVNVTPSTETKTVKSTTTSQTINPTSGKLISQITVQPITLNTVNVTPSTSSQTITPTNDGIGQVNVSAVTSSIDNNIVAENIKKNVSILGVTGTYEGGGSSEYNAKINNATGVVNGIARLISEISSLDTSNVTDMTFMFANCTSLTTIPLLDTGNVTSTGSMFQGCSSLTTIPLLNTSKVTSMTSMFSGCTSLTTIPLLDTSRAIAMGSMFQGCSSLTTIPLLNTSRVSNMTGIVSGCTSLTNESINNILGMCANITSYLKTKTLTALGFNDNQKSIAETLSNWNAFIAAGWSA